MEMKKHSEKISNLIRHAKRVCKLNRNLSRSSALELGEMMNEIGPEDVGITENVAKTLRNINYLHLHEEEAFSMGVFMIPPKKIIPLHDHPGMTVLSRVLFGDLDVLSLDWVGDRAISARQGGIARVRTEKQINGPSLCTLEPDRENLHSFGGGEDKGCAILDIITPPYDDRAGRSCTYYRVTDRDLVVKACSKEAEDEMSDLEDIIFVELKPYNPDFDIDTFYL
jgi:cysteamine dioxygenase